jgi:hypothetical protein
VVCANFNFNTHTHTIHPLSFSLTHTLFHPLSFTHTHTHFSPTLSLSHTHTHFTHSLTHTRTHSNSHSHTHSHALTHTHMHSHALTRTHKYSHTHTHTLTCSHTHSHALTRIHTLTHTHTHSHTLTRTHPHTPPHTHPHTPTHPHTTFFLGGGGTNPPTPRSQKMQSKEVKMKNAGWGLTFLQSIIPPPVLSLNSFTNLALIPPASSCVPPYKRFKGEHVKAAEPVPYVSPRQILERWEIGTCFRSDFNAFLGRKFKHEEFDNLAVKGTIWPAKRLPKASQLTTGLSQQKKYDQLETLSLYSNIHPSLACRKERERQAVTSPRPPFPPKNDIEKKGQRRKGEKEEEEGRSTRKPI